MTKWIFFTGIIFGFLAIILGAFGSHALKTVLNEDSLNSFKTAVDYQMYHAFFLLIFGLLQLKSSERLTKLIYYLCTFGVICFSGSIYLLVLNKHFEFITLSKWFALITPIGGILLVSSWFALAINVLKDFKDNSR